MGARTACVTPQFVIVHRQKMYCTVCASVITGGYKAVIDDHGRGTTHLAFLIIFYTGPLLATV